MESSTKSFAERVLPKRANSEIIGDLNSNKRQKINQDSGLIQIHESSNSSSKRILPDSIIPSRNDSLKRQKSQHERRLRESKEPVNIQTIEKKKDAQIKRRERERLQKITSNEEIRPTLQSNETVLLSNHQKGQRRRREKERSEKSSTNNVDNNLTSTNRDEGIQRTRSRKNNKPINRLDYCYTMDGETVNFLRGSSSLGDSSCENQIIPPLYSNSGETCTSSSINVSTSNDSHYDDLFIDEMEIPSEKVEDIPKERHYLGKMDVICPHCKAYHWFDEKLVNSKVDDPLFGMCCLQGKIRLPLLKPLPPPLKELFEGSDNLAKSFRKNIRSYNASNAFSSLGVTMDDRILNGRGPTSFTIHGELCHKVGSLLPEPGKSPSYAQLYIYDPNKALEHRKNRNLHLLPEVLKIIQETLLESNEMCKLYKQAFEILKDVNSERDHDVPVRLTFKAGTDCRRYNLPTSNDIAVILPGDGSKEAEKRDIVLHLKNHRLERISECHPMYLPSHYVLLFPRGELGWSTELRHWDVKNQMYKPDAPMNRLTQLEYFCYRMFERSSEYSTILRGGPLFQQFVVDAWAAYEQNKLYYLRTNQDDLRAEVYSGLTDIVHNGEDPSQLGKRFILPSSHLGSPRHMYEIYQDSMAITRFNKHPDIFLTATANPKWPEIVNELKPFQNALDRPDLVARVFELKRKAIMHEITNRQLFGKVVGYVYTIEFQKRGLPHMHALIFLAQEDKIRTVDQVDRIVSAEFPDPVKHPALFKTIKKCMIHGPCGTRNPLSSCMVNGFCKSRFRRAHADNTSMDEDGYPIYRRRDTGITYTVRGYEVDNRDIVPYNPYLSEMFDCHINVEVCASVRAVKYIHKYIYKGHDRTTMVVGAANDEIQQYLDSRYVGPIEAAWRLYGNKIHEESPSVTRLALHLKGEHLVVFNPKVSKKKIKEKADNQKSTLTEFFNYYLDNPGTTPYTYQEFPQHFTWDKHKKVWSPRKQGTAIGRMYFANPNSGERFYLRLLLTVVKGPDSFESLYIVGNTKYNTYREACLARGLLEDDNEWDKCIDEACKIRTGVQARKLFCLILTDCNPSRPEVLWNTYSLKLCDDLPHQLRTKFGISNPSDEDICDYGLFLLNEYLLQSGRKLSEFPNMPLPVKDWNFETSNRLLWEHRNLMHEGLQVEAERDILKLNTDQKHAYTIITDSVMNDTGKVFFLNGPAGTGKTFLYNTIAAKIRSEGQIVVMVASSGIASLLLTGGRTAHSTFKIPFDVMDDTVCGFKKNSNHAELFRKTKLIVWDEVPMQHRFCVEAVDRSLQDIMGNDKPFGGITVVLGGDFKQTLPVIPKGTREQIVGASLRNSNLWSNVEALSLVQNMRLDSSNSDNIKFAEYLLKVGTNPEDKVEVPTNFRRCKDPMELISQVYPDLNDKEKITQQYLEERSILSARNDDVSALNASTLNLFPGELYEFLAADKVIEEDIEMENRGNRVASENLNSLDPPSLPPFNLQLKIGCPIMLLRNLQPRDGLCNGTRLMVVNCGTRVIEARILNGSHAGDLVFIPRITLIPTVTETPFPMARRQFPVRLAFAMTINKSQGQSVKYVGIDLRNPVFSHGQLYVAFSRCTSSDRISVLLPNDDDDTTTNVVYPEVLL